LTCGGQINYHLRDFFACHMRLTDANPASFCAGAELDRAVITNRMSKLSSLVHRHMRLAAAELEGCCAGAEPDCAVIIDCMSKLSALVIAICGLPLQSLKAAALGLNLTVANHVVLVDLWWNPTTEEQAIDRAHRIGQTRPVQVSESLLYPASSGSVCECIMCGFVPYVH
jgi:hypothetical protein